MKQKVLLESLLNAVKRDAQKQRLKFKYGVKFNFDDWRVSIPGINHIKMCKNKTFDTSIVDVIVTFINKDKCGDYWCLVKVEDIRQNDSKTKDNKMTDSVLYNIYNV